jgi:D-3-phosphoglycerate dehydrogenase / 2-oxoglutarate reductase
MHILIPDDLPSSALALFHALQWTTDTRTGRPREALRRDIATADAVIVRSATRVDADLIAAATSLKVIARAGVGVDTIDLDAAARRGLVVLNTPDATTTSVAELAIGCLIGLARQLSAADRSMKTGEWAKKRFTGTELAGKTLGLVGCGRIGQRVARTASAMGMSVLATDPRPLPPECAAAAVTLDELCDAADFISIHAPLTPSTRRLFDAARLARCRPGVRLVNTSRGELIDEQALLSALERGHVAGAALDVYDPEPPVDRALASHPAVIATPHIAASTHEAQERVGFEAATAVRDFLMTGVARHAVVAPRGSPGSDV